MTEVSFGFILPTYQPGKGQDPSFLPSLHQGLRLVSGHFDSFWAIDHLSPDDLESFTTLAYLAALYPRLKFGHTVVCQSFRNPALVARMGATLQYLSGGRFLLGIGAGWNKEEYLANGYEFPPAGTRVDQLEEALQIIQALWSGEPAAFSGRHYQVSGAICSPRLDPPPPILVGAFKPRMLRLAARYAGEWNVSSTGIGKYRRLLEAFERACADVGRDPSTMRRSWGGGCTCRPDQREAERVHAERAVADDADDFDFVGTPGQIIEQMHPFIELGVRAFMMDCGGFPDLTTLELLAGEVLPAVRSMA